MQPNNSNNPYLPFYQQQQQHHHHQQQQQQQQPRYVYYPAASAPDAAPAAFQPQPAYHPNMAVTVPLQPQPAQAQAPQQVSSQPLQEQPQPAQAQQQQQQQQLFDYEMLPDPRQLEAEQEEEDNDDTKRLVKPVQASFQQPPSQPASATTATVPPPPQPPSFVFYPPMTTTQYAMPPPPPHPHPHPMPVQQPQSQPQAPTMLMGQPVPTASMHQQQVHQARYHCRGRRWHCHRHRHCRLRQGLHFKLLIIVQLCIAIFLTCVAPHVLTLSIDALFVFGLAMALIQNVPGLVLFSIGNVFVAALSTWALVMSMGAMLHGHGSSMIVGILILLVVTMVQWASFISGIHYTARIVRRRRLHAAAFPPQQPMQPQQLPSVQPHQQFQPQPQHVAVTALPTNMPAGFQSPPTQQAV